MAEIAKTLPISTEVEMKGWLLKWTNYLKGYQRRWFVLSNGVLSYYRAEHGSGNNAVKLSIRRRRKGPRQENQAEMSHTCRGTISLHGALIHTVDSCTFVISNGGTQTFHIKAANERERQSWVTALELAKAKAIRLMESEEEEEETTAAAVPSEELNAVIRELTGRLENLKTCYDLISKHGKALQVALTDLESGDDFANRSKIVNERATLFRITSNAMINACNDYLQTAQSQGSKWSKMLQHEREQRQRLEEMVEQLARQHTQLEQAAHRIIPRGSPYQLCTFDPEDFPPIQRRKPRPKLCSVSSANSSTSKSKKKDNSVVQINKDKLNFNYKESENKAQISENKLNYKYKKSNIAQISVSANPSTSKSKKKDNSVVQINKDKLNFNYKESEDKAQISVDKLNYNYKQSNIAQVSEDKFNFNYKEGNVAQISGDKKLNFNYKEGNVAQISEDKKLNINYKEGNVAQISENKLNLNLDKIGSLMAGKTATDIPKSNTANTTSDDEDNEFYDAQEENLKAETPDENSFILKFQTRRHSRDGGSSSEGEEKSETKQVNSRVLVVREEDNMSKSKDVLDRVNNIPSGNFGQNSIQQVRTARIRRTRVPEKPNYPLNLWSIMKNCIGKELSKIPMPVNFNEPLSMLQRLTEDYEYSDLLDTAAKCTDPCEQLAYVAAFTISSYSTTSNRTGKPFNPLLGETYECDRTDDHGWRYFSEQVSHHPPMAAIHCEGRGWTCWQEFTMTSKFRGKYLQIVPLGNAHVEFRASGNRYTWRKVTTTVHNIIVGKLWVDHTGDMEIIGNNNSKGIQCHLKYIPYSYFTRDTQRRVKGVVMNRSGEVKWVINGAWDNKIEIAPVISTSGTSDNPVYKTGNYKTIWSRKLPDTDSDKYYNFTILASQLNEPEENVAPTDSRLRPDQRLMEDGRWEESNTEKVRLEEKQRAKRRAREAEAETAAAQGRPYPPYEPIWFKKEKEEGTDNLIHVFTGSYWDRKAKHDWSGCPDLF